MLMMKLTLIRRCPTFNYNPHLMSKFKGAYKMEELQRLLELVVQPLNLNLPHKHNPKRRHLPPVTVVLKKQRQKLSNTTMTLNLRKLAMVNTHGVAKNSLNTIDFNKLKDL